MSPLPNKYQQMLVQAQQHHRSGEYAQAHDLYRALTQRVSNNAQLWALLGATQRQLGRLDDARTTLQRAIKLDRQQAMFHHDLALVYKLQGGFEKAHASLDAAIRLRPADAAFRAAKAELHHMEGDYESALKELEPVLTQPVINPSVALMFARLCPRLGRQQDGIDLLNPCLRRSDLPPTLRTKLRFAVADLLDSTGRFDEAFEAYRLANESKAAQFDADAHSRAIDATINAWSRDRVQALARGDSDERPVFILGMPRSGTSLVEQILASHPQVLGRGELGDVLAFTRELGGPAPQLPMIMSLDTLAANSLGRCARAYLEKARRASSTADRCTDKMPLNFLSIGLIALLFPRARIIHCVRDPMDTCLSCYFHLFDGNLAFTYDLETLGRFYNDYVRLMHHWKSVLDVQLLDVVYEELVNDTETVSRRMVEFIGLPWNQACLQFHESKRVTLTASTEQVRQPVYRSAMGRHHQYDRHLAALRRALGPLV